MTYRFCSMLVVGQSSSKEKKRKEEKFRIKCRSTGYTAASKKFRTVNSRDSLLLDFSLILFHFPQVWGLSLQELRRGKNNHRHI